MLWARPDFDPADPPLETVNDADGFVSNFWRAIQAAPDEVARWADKPVLENDLHAVHSWLLARKESLRERLEGDPDFYDAKVAGWWAWGLCCWIGSGWCSGQGPWHVVDGRLVNVKDGGGDGVWRQRPHLSTAGQGVNRKRPHLGNSSSALQSWFEALAVRLRRVRVCCGDWSRIMGPSVIFTHGLTAVFLDPPYSAEAGRDNDLYSHENLTVAHDCREWAIANGDNPLLRIALCGYDGEHAMPDNWTMLEWKGNGGYAGQGKGDTRGKANRARERVWFSPHCLAAESDLLTRETQ